MSFPSVLHARGLPATRPATAPGCSCARRLDQLGVIKIPNFYGSDSHYRPCLQEYYADWAPEKLEPRNLDETLRKYEGREKQMFAALGKKYGKKANFARCVPKKKDS